MAALRDRAYLGTRRHGEAMKSSPLLRKTPLERKTPLRSRIRRFTDEQKAAHRDYVAARAIAYERDGGQCQVPVLLAQIVDDFLARGMVFFPAWLRTSCDGRVDVHHRATQQKWPELAADVDNLLCLCWRHHAAAHGHPVDARAFGLLK